MLAQGGNTYSGGLGGHGGTVTVDAGLGALTTSDVQTHGGYTGNGPGADGGPVTLSPPR